MMTIVAIKIQRVLLTYWPCMYVYRNKVTGGVVTHLGGQWQPHPPGEFWTFSTSVTAAG